MKTHWKKQFNYDYLGSYSLPEGNDLILTIKETKKEMVTGGNGSKEECLVCYFQEDQKPMILNRTNCKVIEKLYNTPYVEEWKGKKIQLHAAKVNAFGETVDALRVRNKIPVTEKPELKPDTEKWNKAIQYYRQNSSFDGIEKHYNISEENKNKLKNEAEVLQS